MEKSHTKGVDRNGERGAVAVFVAVTLALLIMFTALAVDVGHLYGVKNELHNAADAGALAGAHELYDDDGNLDADAAIVEAERVTPLNITGNEVVDDFTVEIGHWSFTTRTFTKSENPAEVEWQEETFDDLDKNTDFINAVRVETRRGDTPSFFAKILGYEDFFVSAEAVAYIGFAGSIPPKTVDQPFAICEQFLKVDDHYSCSVGRTMNESSETGGWTNLENAEGGTCGSTNTPVVKDLLCSGNEFMLNFGELMGTNNGALESTLDKFIADCWNVDVDTPPKEPLSVTLPVVDCLSGGFTQPCEERLVGVVNVDIVWVQRKDKSPAPREMWNNEKNQNWICADRLTDVTDATCWEDFVNYFDLVESELAKNSIYFHPNCGPHPPVGESGGENFGIMAEFPKLVH